MPGLTHDCFFVLTVLVLALETLPWAPSRKPPFVPNITGTEQTSVFPRAEYASGGWRWARAPEPTGVEVAPCTDLVTGSSSNSFEALYGAAYILPPNSQMPRNLHSPDATADTSMPDTLPVLGSTSRICDALYGAQYNLQTKRQIELNFQLPTATLDTSMCVNLFEAGSTTSMRGEQLGAA